MHEISGSRIKLTIPCTYGVQPAGHGPRAKIFLLARYPRATGVRATRAKLIKNLYILKIEL